MTQELDKGTSMTIRKTTAALAFAAALFSGVAYAETVATVSGLNGSATVTPVGGGTPFTVADGYQLQRGETLTVGSNSSLSLTYTVGCPGGAATGVSQLAAGKSKDDILKFFTERYGPWILREPPKEGVHLLAWLVPLAVLIVGPILIFIFVWRRTPRTASSGSDATSASTSVSMSVDEAISEMRERLKSMRGGRHG